MATLEEIGKLAPYIHYYLRNVIGLDWPIEDSSKPSILQEKNPIMYLPLSQQTLAEFLGAEFIDAASKELIFAIVIGLVYHEAAHQLSGEIDVEPLLNNIICDSNDFNIVPKLWPGSIPFTLCLTNAWYSGTDDLANVSLSMKTDRLIFLLDAAIIYLRKLRIKYQGKDERALPKEHPLFSTFEQLKAVMKKARSSDVGHRPVLVKQQCEVLNNFWQEELKKEKTKRKVESLDAALASLSPDVTEIRIQTPLTKKDAQNMKKANDQTLQVVVNILDTVQQRIDSESNKQNGLGNHNDSNDDSVEEFTAMADYPIQANERIVTAVKRELRPLLFERSLKRRTASVVGTSFVPSHFHQIKTNPEAAKIRKTNLRIQRVLDEVAIALVFDRSGSMVSGKKESVAQQTAGIFYKALCSTPKAQIYLLGFNDVSVVIKGRHYLQLTTILRRIPLTLKAKGGTDFPLALKVAINLIEKIAVHKRIIFILTDGDVTGSYDAIELVNEASRKNIEVFVIAVEGNDYSELADQFGKTNVIKIDHISDLPFQIKKVVVESLNNLND